MNRKVSYNMRYLKKTRLESQSHSRLLIPESKDAFLFEKISTILLFCQSYSNVSSYCKMKINNIKILKGFRLFPPEQNNVFSQQLLSWKHKK